MLSDLSFTDRLSDFIVTVSNISFPVTSNQLVSPAFTLCGQYQGYPGPGQRGTVICSPGPSRGRYVFISLPTLGVLTMCETRVFAGRLKAKFKVLQQSSPQATAQCQRLWDLFYWRINFENLVITIHSELRYLSNIANYFAHLQVHCQYAHDEYMPHISVAFERHCIQEILNEHIC